MIRLFESIRRMLTLRRRQREMDRRLYDLAMRARIQSIRERTAIRTAEFERVKARYEPGAIISVPTFDPTVPIFVSGGGLAGSELVPFEGKGGASGGAGATANWEAPDKNCFTRGDGACVSEQSCMHTDPPVADVCESPSPSQD